MFPYSIISSANLVPPADTGSRPRPAENRRQASELRTELDALGTVLAQGYFDARGNNEAGARAPTTLTLPGSRLHIHRLRSGTTASVEYKDLNGERRVWQLDKNHPGLEGLAKRAEEYAAMEDALRLAEATEQTGPTARRDGTPERKRQKTTASTLSRLESLPPEIMTAIIRRLPRFENAAHANMIEALRSGGRAGATRTNTVNKVKPVEHPDGLRYASPHIYRYFRGETDSMRKAAHLIRRACDIHRLVTPEQRTRALAAILDDAFAVPHEDKSEGIDRRLDELRAEIASQDQSQQAAKKALRAEGARLWHQKSKLLPEDLGEVIAAASYALEHLPAASTALQNSFDRIATIAASLEDPARAKVVKGLCQNVGRLHDGHRMAGVGSIVQLVATLGRSGDLREAFINLEKVLPSMPQDDHAFSLLKTLAAVSGRLENQGERQHAQGILLRNLHLRGGRTTAGFALKAEVLTELEMAGAGGWAARDLPALLRGLDRDDRAEGARVAAEHFAPLENEDARTHAARYLLEFAASEKAPFDAPEAADRIARNSDQLHKYYLIEPLCRALAGFRDPDDRAGAFTLATRWVDDFTDRQLVTYALDLLQRAQACLAEDDRDQWQAWFHSTSERAGDPGPA
ncbi:MAG TPA: hypothetical protein VIM12_01910 [Noviherbaspirillum sp.]|jgi:hypothetical protein|uniref:hypothetical protein n=1 Tax=Noviherbaspirillum sp. TaxID=1926288 RepID=UPI002F91ED74